MVAQAPVGGSQRPTGAQPDRGRLPKSEAKLIAAQAGRWDEKLALGAVLKFRNILAEWNSPASVPVGEAGRAKRSRGRGTSGARRGGFLLTEE